MQGLKENLILFSTLPTKASIRMQAPKREKNQLSLRKEKLKLLIREVVVIDQIIHMALTLTLKILLLQREKNILGKTKKIIQIDSMMSTLIANRIWSSIVMAKRSYI